MWRDLAGFFADLDTLLSQPLRAVVVRKFCQLATQKLKESGSDEDYRSWLAGGKARFIRQCEIQDGLPAVADNLTLAPESLSSFCGDWLNATRYRSHPEATWRAFTPEQNHLRMAMLRQLTALASRNETADLTSCDHVV